MDLDSLPLQVEVMGWNPRTLADFMRKLQLPGCDKAVIRGSITGAQFMQMTPCELHGFPSVYVPIITKIQSDIHSGEKREQRKTFGKRLMASVFPKKVLVPEEDSDEFENGSDKDYDDAQEGQSEDHESSRGNNFEMTSPAHTTQPQHGGADKLHTEQDDSECSCEDTPPERRPSPPPPCPPRRAIAPNERLPPLPRREKDPPTPAPPHFERRTKPRQPRPSKENLSKPKEGGNIMYSDVRCPRPRAPTPTERSYNRASEVSQAPAVPVETQTFANLKPEPEKGLDPGWYGGKLTRQQAEVALRQINEDGAFVVRDSSRGSTEHPYTLMVLKEGRVYNIKIMNNGHSYSFGNNPKTSQRYPGVREMIAHYTHTPLLLIDAIDRRPGAESQCCLLHPVGI
ncbi:lymphocyte cytosolic protein 2 [Genypterus blacodes]|uniref:lymphocyte cytosolic protein 2 n=1 Tax=Genypterus blacodes TaxID=154954 RepID=UPI003F769FF1